MFFRLLMESFRRQRRRKMLAGIAILLGTTAVTAMLALATTIGDRIHKELAVYGANIVVYPKADLLGVKIGGVDVKPASGGVYLKESDLEKLKTIFWANNITGVSPELRSAGRMARIDYFAGLKVRWIPAEYAGSISSSTPVDIVGYWFDHPFGTLRTGAPQLHPWWKLQGRWPSENGDVVIANSDREEVVVGSKVAQKFDLHIGDDILLRVEHIGRVVGIVTADDQTDESVLYALDAITPVMQPTQGNAGREEWSPDISRIEISARTKPEDAFARVDPDSLSPQQHEIWYCRPYANSIAYQIREAIPGAAAEQVRRVEQSEGNVLNRISGLMWLVSAAALLAAGFAVSAAMATAVLERRGEIGLMRSLGASKGAIALLFYAETGLLAILAGTLGYFIGSGLAAWLGARIFSGDGGSVEAVLNPVLLPVVVALALVVAIAGSTPSIRSALRMDPSAILRADA
jgi:putative ABC transport system permease protein